VSASNEALPKTEKPNLPMPVGAMFILALEANVVLQSPSLRAGW
jgi:hypothetical protein